MPTDRRTLSGVGLVGVGVLSVQFGASVATLVFPVTGPGGAVWLRLLLSALLLAVVLPATRLAWPLSRLGWSRETWLAVTGFGVVLGGMNWSFYEALARIPLGPAVALEFTGPLTLALVLSRRALDAGWAVLAAGGIALLTLDPFGVGPAAALDPLGVALALFAGLCWAGYILASRRVGRLVPGARGLSAALVVAAVLTTPVGLAAAPRLVEPWVLVAGLGIALLSSVLPYTAELEALRRLPARVFGILLSTEPAAAALVGLVVLGQLLAGVQWWGIGLVSLASAGAAVTARERAREPRDRRRRRRARRPPSRRPG